MAIDKIINTPRKENIETAFTTEKTIGQVSGNPKDKINLENQHICRDYPKSYIAQRNRKIIAQREEQNRGIYESTSLV